jgi:hypothetical protein
MRQFFISLLGFVLLLAASSPVRAQVLTAELLPGSKIDKESGYDGTSLYGYIDGGSTLYFEYGFDRLIVQEITFQSEKFTVEYYRMKSCLGAFGIYSINTFQCADADLQGMISCQNPHQLQLFVGHCYISIVNTTGTAVAGSASLTLAQKLEEIIPSEEGLQFPGFLTEKPSKITGEVKYIQGELGLQNGLPDWSDYLAGIRDFKLWIQLTRSGDKDSRHALLTFAGINDLGIFLQQASLVPSGSGWKSKEGQSEKWNVTKKGENQVWIVVN